MQKCSVEETGEVTHAPLMLSRRLLASLNRRSPALRGMHEFLNQNKLRATRTYSASEDFEHDSKGN